MMFLLSAAALDSVPFALNKKRLRIECLFENG